MAKFCDKCGAELKNNNARFCDKCGAEVKITNNQNSGTTTVGKVVCPHCGQTTAMGLTHCEKCGSQLEIENNTVAVIVGYIVSLIIPIIGVIPAIYLLTRNNGKAKTQGVLIIGFIVIYIIFNLLLQNWAISLVIMILVTVLGIFLWYQDFNLFD